MRLTRSVLALGVLLLSLLPRSASAQTVAGIVIDSATRLPARLLIVHVLGDSGRIVAETRTDTTGVFYANLATGGPYRLRFAVDTTMTFDSDTIRVPGDDMVQRRFVIAFPRQHWPFEVEKQVQARRGYGGPRYPVTMRQANIEGEVLAQFVVDSAGTPLIGTFRAVRSTHPDFSEAVRTWLRTARYDPAILHGHPVAQMVSQPFTFALSRAGPSLESTRSPAFPAPPRWPPLP